MQECRARVQGQRHRRRLIVDDESVEILDVQVEILAKGPIAAEHEKHERVFREGIVPRRIFRIDVRPFGAQREPADVGGQVAAGDADAVMGQPDTRGAARLLLAASAFEPDVDPQIGKEIAAIEVGDGPIHRAARLLDADGPLIAGPLAHLAHEGLSRRRPRQGKAVAAEFGSHTPETETSPK